MSRTQSAQRIAYSYLRYSTTEQGEGDSIRRQTDPVADWCKRNGYTLDPTSYVDAGVSGFRGKHRETGNLRRFLDDVQAGHIPRGSALVVEALDRLTREDPWTAVALLGQLVGAGIDVVALGPVETVYSKDNANSLILAVVGAGQGHGESLRKSQMLTAVWGEKKKRSRAEKTVETTRVPEWLTVVGDRKKVNRYMVGGEFKPVPAKVKVVKKIFALAKKGLGLSMIVNKLTADGDAPITRERNKWGVGPDGRMAVVGTHPVRWSKAYVHNILSDRSVLGVYQPKRYGKPEGEPIPGYYPRIIDDGPFNDVQKRLADRTEKRADGTVIPRGGRVGAKGVAVFGGLVWDARTGEKMLVSNQTRGPKGDRSRRRVFVPAGSMEGRTDPRTGEKMKARSFPLDVFEPAILEGLKEINPDEVFGKQPDAVAELKGEKARIERAIANLNAYLDANEDDPDALKRLRDRRLAYDDVSRRLAAAEAARKNPPAVAFASAQTLMDAATGPQKLRLRQLLRDSIQKVWMVVVPRGGWRLAHVQVDFAGEPFEVLTDDDRMSPVPLPWDEDRKGYVIRRQPFRQYLIVYKLAANGRKGGIGVRSLKHPEDAYAGVPFGIADNLADRVTVEHIESLLEAYGLEMAQKIVDKYPAKSRK